MIAVSTTGVSSWAEKSVVTVADEPESRNLDNNVSEDVLKELPDIGRANTELQQSSSSSSPEPPVLMDGSAITTASKSKEPVGLDVNSRRSTLKSFGASPPNPLPMKRSTLKSFGASPPNPLPMNMIPHHGVAPYRYGYNHSTWEGHFVQGWQGNHSTFPHGRPPMFWSTSHGSGAHIPPFYNGKGTPPRPYWDSMHHPDFWSMPFRPPLHHLPPASIPNYVDPMPSRIVKQIDYYFSEPNLVKDMFLRSKMDNQGWVPISLIASFPRVKQMTKSISFILRSLRFSNVVEVQGDRIRKRDNWKKWILTLDE